MEFTVVLKADDAPQVTLAPEARPAAAAAGRNASRPAAGADDRADWRADVAAIAARAGQDIMWRLWAAGTARASMTF